MKSIYLYVFSLILLSTLICALSQDPAQKLKQSISNLLTQRKLKGIQIQIANRSKPIFYYNQGEKNKDNQPIDTNTVFTLASLSKSFNGVAILQLVQKGLLRLNDTLSSILGFQIKNPYFPNISITVQMLLSHQSSISEVDPQYSNFVQDTLNSKDGASIPSLRQILLPGGKYYNESIFRSNRKPGQSFRYSNLGYTIAGTIVQIISKKRFDIYQKQNILDIISQGQSENATFNPATIKNYKNIATIFIGKNGSWIPSIDNYTGPIQQANLKNYTIGTNAGTYGPAYGLKGNMHHMSNYMYMLSNKGVTKSGKRILYQESVNQLIKPRYQYQGSGYVVTDVFHLYGLGIYTTSYLQNDIVIQHQVVRGHLGNAFGLISACFYWKDYTYSYIINGALNGYERPQKSLYQVERVLLDKAVNEFIVAVETSSQTIKKNNQSEIQQ